MPRRRQKEANSETLNVCVTPTMRDRIATEAEQTERSDAAIVRSILKAAGYDQPLPTHGMPKPRGVA